MAVLDLSLLDTLIKPAVAVAVEEAVTKAIEEAKATVESELRKKIAGIVIACMTEFSVDRMGNTLTIKVKLPEKM